MAHLTTTEHLEQLIEIVYPYSNQIKDIIIILIEKNANLYIICIISMITLVYLRQAGFFNEIVAASLTMHEYYF